MHLHTSSTNTKATLANMTTRKIKGFTLHTQSFYCCFLNAHFISYFIVTVIYACIGVHTSARTQFMYRLLEAHHACAHTYTHLCIECTHTQKHTRAYTHTHACMHAGSPVVAVSVSTFLDDASFKV